MSTTEIAVPAVPALPVPSFFAKKSPATVVGPPKSFMLYGPTGTRKSSAIGQIVKAGRFNRAVIIDADNGTEVFANDEDVMAAVEDGRITIIPVDTTIMSPTEAFLLIENTILETAGAWRTPAGHIEINPNIPDFGIDLLVLDTLNIIQGVAVKHFLSTTFNDKGLLDTRGAWGAVSVWTEEMVRLMHNSKRFTGAFIAHPKEVEEKSGAVKIKPSLQGGIKDTIATIPSLVAYLSFEVNPETKADEIVATVGESATYESKNRYLLPSKIRNFDLVELYKTIDAKSNRGTTPAAAVEPTIAINTNPAAVAA